MSLINDMLRDLDKRKAPGPQLQQPDGPVIPAASLKRNLNFRWVFWLMVIVGVSLLSALLFKLYGTYDQKLQSSMTEKVTAEAILHPDQMAQLQPGQETTSTAPDQLISSNENNTVALQSMRFSQINSGVRIEIKLSAAVDHRVEIKNDRELLIQLPNAELSAQLPSIAEYSLINAIDVASDQGNLLLKVLLASKATVQTYLLNQGSSALLVVELSAAHSPELATTELAEESAPQSQSVDLRNTPDSRALTQNPYEQLTEIDVVLEPENLVPSSFAKTTRQKSQQVLDKEASQQALSLFRAGKGPAAVAFLRKMIEQNPQAILSRETLIAILLTQSRYDDAQYVIDEALAKEPNKAAIIKLQARLFMARNEQVAALLLLKRLKNANADDPDYLSMLATLHQQQGQHAEAASLYRDLLNRDSDRSDWWVGLAISLEGLGQKNDALQAYLQTRRIPQINASLKQYADERIRALN